MSFFRLSSAVLCLCIFIVSSEAWLFSKHKVKDCPPAPDYSGCRFKSPCDPNRPNPCGCEHACCKKDTSFTIGVGVGGGGVTPIVGTGGAPGLPGWYCFKKGRCGQFCGGLHGVFNGVSKCGCGQNMRCHKHNFFQAKKCKL